MIDLKSLAEFARRSGALMPVELFPIAQKDDPRSEACELVSAWLTHWGEIPQEVKAVLVEHLGLESSEELHSQIVVQGLRLSVEWLSDHGDLPLRVQALHRAALGAE